MIDFPSNEHTTPGYLARPDDEAQHPGLVVIQEWWGLNEHIKDVTQRFAREGFVAVAPDLYHGTVVSEPDETVAIVVTGTGLKDSKSALNASGGVTPIEPYLEDVAALYGDASDEPVEQ
jgi:carboxymethylenebutenolidase